MPANAKRKKDGHQVTHFANGNTRSEGAFKNGKKEGPWTLYHKNGHKQSEATFKNGFYTGYYVSYHDNGNKFREGWYSEASGNAYDGRKEGVWYQYLPDGKTVDVKVTYKHGRVVERLHNPDETD